MNAIKIAISTVKKLWTVDDEVEKQHIREQTFINWINHYIQQKDQQISKLEDLICESSWKILFEILWEEDINIEIDNHLKKKEKKIENFRQMIKFLKTKNIDISDLQTEIIIRKKHLLIDLLQIIWMTISYHSIDWIDFYGLKGQNALLKWINQYTDQNFQNFADSWDNGKTIINILQHYYPNDIDIEQLEINDEQSNIMEYAFSCLSKVNVPVYINPNHFQYLDEQSIILQYATLFDFTSKGNVLNPSKSYNNTSLNNNEINQKIEYYNPNDHNSLYEQPDMCSGMIEEKELQELNQNVNKVVQKINEHFKTIIHPRYPVQVAYINDENGELKVCFDFDKFKEVVMRARQRPIIFVSCLGRYQQGKSTIISCFTGNIGYAIGNGKKETTKGVYIDGPYNINYLYKRFNVEMRKDIYFGGNELLSPLVFFFDIEGYDGIMHGNNQQKNNQAFIEMCTPFLCLSSIFLFLSEPNPSASEMQNLLERMKVSNLTTYSNDNSNGALQLHIILNKNTEIYDKIETNIEQNIKNSIKEFKKTYSAEWIGGESLRNYGIKYDFLPVASGLSLYYKNGYFFTIFQYFASHIIKSIENATEGSFVRCGPQSINLFHYIKQHYNEPLFETKIKKLIKNEHEHSFHTLSNRAYDKSSKKIFPFIEKEFEKFENNFLLNVDIDAIKNKYINTGENEIKKELNVVKDHPDVSYFIELFIISIRNVIDDKYDHYLKARNDMISQINSQIDKIALDKISVTINLIFEELSNNNNFDFNEERIRECINKRIQSFSNELFQYKNENNLQLLSNEKIKDIIQEKRIYLTDTVTKYISLQKNNIIEFNEEEAINSHFIILQKKLIRDKYYFYADSLLLDLRNSLKNRQFYLENYRNLTRIHDAYQQQIFNLIELKKEELTEIIIHSLIEQNSRNKLIIERLQQKNELTFDSSIIRLIINENQNNLPSCIDDSFERAKFLLAEIKMITRRTRLNYKYAQIESKKIMTFPDGSSSSSEWEIVRIEKRSFKEILDDISESITETFTILVSTLSQATEIVLGILNIINIVK